MCTYISICIFTYVWWSFSHHTSLAKRSSSINHLRCDPCMCIMFVSIDHVAQTMACTILASSWYCTAAAVSSKGRL